MKKWHYNPAAALLPLLAPSAVLASAAAASDDNDQCRLYLAESTIPGGKFSHILNLISCSAHTAHPHTPYNI
eukprot:scaffold9361_cov133-Skeletonema_dohrnii-CCMP3373.AAC.2